MSPNDFSDRQEFAVITAGLAEFGFGNGWRICKQGVHESGFARAVAARQGVFLAADYTRRKILNYMGGVVGFGHAFEFENVLARRTFLLELQKGTLNVRLRQFGHLQSLYLFAPRLHLAGTSARG